MNTLQNIKKHNTNCSWMRHCYIFSIILISIAFIEACSNPVKDACSRGDIDACKKACDEGDADACKLKECIGGCVWGLVPEVKPEVEQKCSQLAPGNIMQKCREGSGDFNACMKSICQSHNAKSSEECADIMNDKYNKCLVDNCTIECAKI